MLKFTWRIYSSMGTVGLRWKIKGSRSKIPGCARDSGKDTPYFDYPTSHRENGQDGRIHKTTYGGKKDPGRASRYSKQYESITRWTYLGHRKICIGARGIEIV